jgi:hypothetical protein
MQNLLTYMQGSKATLPKAAAGFRIPKCFAQGFPFLALPALDCGSLLPLSCSQPAVDNFRL